MGSEPPFFGHSAGDFSVAKGTRSIVSAAPASLKAPHLRRVEHEIIFGGEPKKVDSDLPGAEEEDDGPAPGGGEYGAVVPKVQRTFRNRKTGDPVEYEKLRGELAAGEERHVMFSRRAKKNDVLVRKKGVGRREGCRAIAERRMSRWGSNSILGNRRTCAYRIVLSPMSSPPDIRNIWVGGIYKNGQSTPERRIANLMDDTLAPESVSPTR